MKCIVVKWDGSKDLGFPGAFMHLSAAKHTIKGEAAVLIDWGKGVEVEVPTTDT